MLDLINKELIDLSLEAKDQDEVLEKIAKNLLENGVISEVNSFLEDVKKREEDASTYIGYNIAIPHAKSENCLKPAIAFVRTKKNINFGGNEVNTLFLIAMPNGENKRHLEAISILAQKLASEEFRDNLAKAKTKEDILDMFDETKSFKAKSSEGATGYDLVAITACPVGIAHTYIAAENLQKSAEGMGLKIKVQTNGSIGIKNALTPEDIKGAKAVIIASDIDIDLSSFAGKPMVKTRVGEAINKPKALVERAIEASKNQKDTYSGSAVSSEKTSVLFNVYKELMNGVSYMIPFIVLGGVFIALAIAFSGITPGKGAVITNPFLKHMMDIGGLSFSMVNPILAGFIAVAIAGRGGLIAGIIAGLLSSQFGAGFLGSIIGGFAGGYFIKYLSMVKFPKAIESIVPVLIIPLMGGAFAAVFMGAIGFPIQSLMVHMTNGLNSMQNNGSSLILYAILGLMVAADMGGPINKVAFLFGVTMIQAGMPNIMGPIAAAIAVPPLGMALATFLSPSKYSDIEKQAAKAAIPMGLCGITEGAIPFAAADPIRVIPSIMIGSCVAAVSCGYFKVLDYAPHGGFIVIPVITNKLAYIFSVCLGIIVSALIVNLLKRKKTVNA